MLVYTFVCLFVCMFVCLFIAKVCGFMSSYVVDSLGFAHMASPIGKEKSPEFGSSSLGGVFKVDWVKK